MKYQAVMKVFFVDSGLEKLVVEYMTSQNKHFKNTFACKKLHHILLTAKTEV